MKKFLGLILTAYLLSAWVLALKVCHVTPELVFSPLSAMILPKRLAKVHTVWLPSIEGPWNLVETEWIN